MPATLFLRAIPEYQSKIVKPETDVFSKEKSMSCNKHFLNRFLPFNLLILLAFLLSAVPAFAATGTEFMEPGQPEYMQGDIAYIYGIGFEPNHQVVVQVIRVDNSIVTGNGTETPGSDIITTDPYGAFIYPYLLDGGTTAQYYGTLTVNAIDTADMVTVLTRTTFLDNPQVGLQGCSRDKGDCTESATPLTGWADGSNPMNGWTSGEVKGWYELEDVPYRLRINPRESSDAKNYYLTVEHDNLKNGITGVDSASGFYMGAGPDMSGYTQGILTKNCVSQAYRPTGDNPTTSKPCIITGPTYSGVDDDGDGYIDEDAPDGIDNDNDGKIDEDPPPSSSTSGERRIEYTVAFKISSSEVGHNKKWAIYWKAHLASGSSNYPGASLHAHTSIGGSQDVPIKNVLASQQADVSITKTGSPDPVTAGNTLTYSITVHNNGPGSAKNVTVTDTLPGSVTLISALPSSGSCSGTSTVTCSLGTIANGSSVTISIDVTPNTAGTINNTATVSTTTNDLTSGNNTASASTTVNPPPSFNADLSIDKTASLGQVVASGGLTYTITVTNLGPSAASDITVTDNLPGGVSNINASGSGWNCVMSGYLVTCSRANLSVGVAPVITITVNAPSSGCALSNTASVTATQNDPVSSNNTKTISTNVTASVNLSITKTAFPNPVTAGGILAYTITVANAGPSTATNVVVTDNLPVGTAYIGGSGTGWTCSHVLGVVTCSRASLGVTTAPAITISVTAPASGGSISNTASVVASEAETSPGDNTTGPVLTTVTASSDLVITKTIPPGIVYAGQNLTYTITVTNNGPSTANNVTVSDTLPVGVTFFSYTPSQGSCTGTTIVSCNLGSLADNTSATVLLVVTMGTTSPINNTATVSNTNDPNSANNTSSVSTAVTPSADLSIIKTGPASVTAGGALTYTLAVTNNGPSTAASVSVSDTLPSGVSNVSAAGTGWACTVTGLSVSCTQTSLAVGAAQAITITGTAPAASGQINNTATISSSATHDPNGGNNTSTALTTVIASADVSITKSASPNPVSAGGTLTYSITVTNNGPSTANNVTVADTLPASVTLGIVTPSQGTCTGTTTINCNLGTLTNSASATITITVTPNTVGTIYNSASVTATENDPNNANNTTPSVSTTVNPPPTIDADLSISKTGSPNPVTAGGTLTYTISVSNAGPNPATNVTVLDTLPTGLSNISAAGTGWGCTVSGLSVSCIKTSLAIGAAPNITITAKAPSEGGTISNTASVTATENDPFISNNTTLLTPVITTVNASSDLTITKTGTATVTAGGTVTYTVTAVNNGPSTATGVQVTDTLPSGVTFVSATGSGWTCLTPVGMVVTCNLAGSLAVGSSPAITITVTAPTTGGVITNNASVSGSVPDPNAGNNTASAPTTVYALADISLTFVDSPDPVIAGTNLTYTLTAANIGPSPATNLAVTQNLPPNMNYVSAVGTGWTCTHPSTYVVSCTTINPLPSGSSAPAIAVVVTPIEGGSMTSTASATASENDPVTTNNINKTATTTVTASSDLSIAKTDLTDPVTTGGSLTYLLTVTNNGPSTASSLSVTDNLVPAGVTYVSASGTGWTCSQSVGLVTCTRASLTYNTSSSITLNVTAPSTAGMISNTASVSSAVNDPVSGDNSSTQITTVNAPSGSSADISITKTDSPDPVAIVGDNVTYTIIVTNNGPNTATGVTVTDTLNSLTYVPALSTPTCTGTTTVTCPIGTLANGASATITIVAGTNPPSGMISNTATVTLNETDLNMANNSATAATNVGDVSRLINVSTRALSLTGSNVLVGGFWLGGATPKQLLIRGRGPSMSGAPFNIPGTMSNPTLQIYSMQTNTVIAQNDNWQVTDPTCANSGFTCGSPAEITALAVDPCVPNPGQTVAPPGCANESAILITLPPGGYSATITGVNGGTGVALVEVFDPDTTTMPKLINISSRDLVQTGSNVLVGGFWIGAGTGSKKVMIRGRGPSMSGAPFNISGTLSNPNLQIYSFQTSTVIAQNDNWQTLDSLCASRGFVCGSAAEITATGMDPCISNPGQTTAPLGCSNESALLITLPPGGYSATVSGVNGGTGIGLVDITEISQ